MKKVLTILAVALFLGACHCTKCTRTPNRSNTCAKAAIGHRAHFHKAHHPKPVMQQAPAPVPAPVAKPAVTEDAALSEVATVSQKTETQAVLSFKEPINFAYNSDVIQDDSIAQIRKTANVLKKYPNAQVRVAGYTDSLGDPAYNVDLSQRRAQAVADQLVKNGVAAENVTSVGHGAKNPVATNKTREGRAANRRVELEITNK